MSSGQPTSHYILASFLASAFAPEDFLTFLGSREDTAQIVRHLSDRQPSAQFFSDAAVSLARYGLVDNEFFAALATERPARKTEIQQLAAAICAAASDDAPAGLMTRHRAEAELEVRLAIPIEDFTVETLNSLVTTVRALTKNLDIITIHIRAGSTIVTLWCTFADLRFLLNPRLPPPLVELGVVAVQPRRFLTLSAERDDAHRQQPEFELAEVHDAPRERSQTRKLVGVIIALTITLVLVLVSAFRLVSQVLTHPMASPGRSDECVDDDESDCPEGQFCVDHRCVEDVDLARPICRPEGTCGTGVCDCGPGLECNDGVCVHPEPSASICDDPKLVATLTRLRAACKDEHCSPPEFMKSFDDYGFARSVVDLRDALTVHFPAGMPPISERPAWPDTPTREYYLNQLDRYLPELAAAKHVFVVARSSRLGDPRRNEQIYHGRREATKALIFEAMRRRFGREFVDSNAVRAKFTYFTLWHEAPLTRESFRHQADRAVMWSEHSSSRLRQLLEREDLAAEHATWLDRVINQATIVIPVPCDLDAAN